MVFNHDPNKQVTEVLISCKKKPVQHPEFIFNEKINKAKKNVGIIKHLNSVLPFFALKQMYNALIRYCDVIFHIPPKILPPPLGISLHDHMEKLEKVQYQAARSLVPGRAPAVLNFIMN